MISTLFILSLPAIPEVPRVQPEPELKPIGRLEADFNEFHRTNPQVYELIYQMVTKLLADGKTRFGIARVYEELRYEIARTGTKDHYKLNNNHKAFYGRKLIEDYPALAAVITLRERTAA